MFDVIRKSEYFECLDRGFANAADYSLKGIQDGWMLQQLHDEKGKRIIEVGGGNSRVLSKLTGNTRWNVDKFEGVGNGPTTAAAQSEVTIIPTFMGEFSPEVPEVDIIFSISVIEHIPFEKYCDAFKDMARCLAKGGVMYHAIDIPVADEPLEVSQRRIRLLKEAIIESGLVWKETPVISDSLIFGADMASNSDITAWGWGKISAAFRASGPFHQLVSIKLIASKA